MPYSKPTQLLVDEHEVITSVLDAVEAVARRADADDEFPQSFYEKAFDFFRNFADRFHHAKEETRLFPLLEARGVPRNGGPIGCLLSEHDEGRARVAFVREELRRTAEGDREARESVRGEALAYAALLRQHILKENEILFVVGDRSMTAQDKDELWRQFQEAEQSVFPRETREKYVALSGELHAAAGL